MRFPIHLASAVCTLFFFAVTPAHAAVTYTFEGLTTPSVLDGSDNWTNAGNAGQPPLDVIFGTNGSTVAANPGGNGTMRGTRQNDGTFSIPTFTGNEGTAYIEADFRFVDGPNFWFFVRSAAALGPWIGLVDDAPSGPSTPAFAVRPAAHATGSNS